jgi:signal transduction histidine kinase
MGLVTLAFLIRMTVIRPPGPADLLPVILFGVLIVFTTTFGVPLGGGEVSLLPMTTVAAYLVIGPLPAAWAAFLGALIHGWVRQRWAGQLEARREPNHLALVAVSLANATMHSFSILIGGWAFAQVGGTIPLATRNWRVAQLLILGTAYLLANLSIAAIYIGMLGRASLRLYLRSLPNLIAYEASPLVFAPLMALIYTHLGLGQFLLFALALGAASLISRSLAYARRRLERRVKELDSLQAIGQALSASLDLDTTLWAVYTQVSRLMPARNFYIALYGAETEEVSFPLTIEGGQQANWRSRRMGNGLTEYILRNPAPLLMPRDVGVRLGQLGLEQIGQPAASWLGVPILAGNDVLGVVAVQSYDTPGVYDISHQEVLVTIAAQAAVAIQNARLYARTDEALARRVQELDSILRTTREGVLLLDSDCRVLAANRALADFLGLALSDLIGQMLDAPREDGVAPLITRIGYTSGLLRRDCQALDLEEHAQQRTIVALGLSGRYFERTLVAVYDRGGASSGWLLIFRDVTEEVELARLREDMTHMLVHDLRAPLSVLKGSLGLIEYAWSMGDTDKVERALGLAHGGCDRMLHMVSELLDINKLESGQLLTRPEAVDVGPLLRDTAHRLAPLAGEARITVEVVAAPDLPPLYVDPGLVGRVLNNLLDNAIKFTPDDGRVQLWASLEVTDYPSTEPTMLLGVSDTGPGIPPEAQARLFQKFQQMISTAGRRRGTGLGLPFCKLAVEAHGGEIWVESPSERCGSGGEYGGTTFIMRLPTTKNLPALSD